MLRYLAQGERNFRTWPVPPSKRLNWEFYAVTAGSCAPYFPKGDSPALRSMALWLLPAHTTYGWRGNGKPCQRVAMHFAAVPAEVKDALGSQAFLVAPLSMAESKRLLGLAGELMVHWKSPNQYSHLVCEKALLELSILILQSHPPRKGIPLENLVNERVERAKAWFVVHMSLNPTVDEVALALHMTSTHLRRIFRQACGHSPHEVFRQLQMKRATELLATTSDTIAEVARQCGFKTPNDFSRVFRKAFQASPDTWRRKIMAEN